MTRYLYIYLFFILFSCKTKKENYYYWVTVDGDGCEKAEIIKIREIIKSYVGDSVILRYLTDTGQIRYAFPLYSDTATVISNIPDLVIKPNKKKPTYFIRVFDSNPNRKIDTAQIQQYMMVGFVGNQDKVHYFDKNLGVYVVLDIFGPWRRYLQSTDSAINKKLDSLIELTFSGPNIASYVKRCQ